MTTNRDWLFSLPLEEQYAWMNAEHQDGTLDGIAAALEAEYGKGGVVGGSFYDEAEPGEAVFPFKLITGVANKLNEDLTAERDKLQEQLLIGWECECRLQAERDELKAEHERIVQELVDANTRQCERTNELTAERDNLAADLAECEAERERYREKFGKCIDYADAIHALMDDEGMA